MLKQILQNMRIEPEILNGLTDQEKQTLFCIMREEQIKRWRDWDIMKTEGERNNDSETYTSVNLSSQAAKKSKKLKKYSVEWLLGSDGEPWVWVMGEHENDKSIEQILGDEAQKKARELAEQETKELRKSVGAELTDILEYNNTNTNNNHSHNKSHNTTSPVAEEKRSVKIMEDEGHTPIIDDLEIYCTVDELRERMNNSSNKQQQQQQQNQQQQQIGGSPKTKPKINVLQEISYNRPQIAAKNSQKVAARVALWEQRLIAERSTEILLGIQKKQEEKAKEAEEAAKSCDHLWKEQERKAKEAELKMRDIARKAREEHRKSMNCDQLEAEASTSTSTSSFQPPRRSAAVSIEKSPSPPQSLSPPSSLDSGVPRPPNPEAVLRWYRDSEMTKGTGRESSAANAGPAKWFHGLLSRTEAESLLGSRAQGSFLVRLSEKIYGYAISYKAERCKHYLVDASSGHYQFLGTNQTAHRSLQDLINVHATTPITASGNELLKVAVPNYRSWDEILQK